MGLHIDLESVYARNSELKKLVNTGKFELKGGLIINCGDNPTKKSIEKKKLENIKRFGLSFDYYNTLNPPKAKTREWLKVLTIPQIMRSANRFSVSQKIHQLVILKIACKKKLKACLKFTKYK